MNNHDSIDALNDVLKMLHDSYAGYEKAAEVCEDTFVFRTEFSRRAQDRAVLINELQMQVSTLGGRPETEGGALGALHRATLEFSTLFRDDEKAALEAIDDGESELANYAEQKLKSGDLTVEARALLDKVRMSAQQGERFAERYENV